MMMNWFKNQALYPTVKRESIVSFDLKELIIYSSIKNCRQAEATRGRHRGYGYFNLATSSKYTSRSHRLTLPGYKIEDQG